MAGAAVVGVTAGVVVSPPAAMAAAGCQATYTVVSQWPTGFQASIQVTSLGDPLNGWALEFDFPDATQRLSHGWTASWS